MTERTTMCKECGRYYSVRYDADEVIYQYTEKNGEPIWEPMPNAKVSQLAIPDYQTQYTCFFCDRKLWT